MQFPAQSCLTCGSVWRCRSYPFRHWQWPIHYCSGTASCRRPVQVRVFFFVDFFEWLFNFIVTSCCIDRYAVTSSNLADEGEEDIVHTPTVSARIVQTSKVYLCATSYTSLTYLQFISMVCSNSVPVSTLHLVPQHQLLVVGRQSLTWTLSPGTSSTHEVMSSDQLTTTGVPNRGRAGQLRQRSQVMPKAARNSRTGQLRHRRRH